MPTNDTQKYCEAEHNEYKIFYLKDTRGQIAFYFSKTPEDNIIGALSKSFSLLLPKLVKLGASNCSSSGSTSKIH